MHHPLPVPFSIIWPLRGLVYQHVALIQYCANPLTAHTHVWRHMGHSRRLRLRRWYSSIFWKHARWRLFPHSARQNTSEALPGHAASPKSQQQMGHESSGSTGLWATPRIACLGLLAGAGLGSWPVRSMTSLVSPFSTAKRASLLAAATMVDASTPCTRSCLLSPSTRISTKRMCLHVVRRVWWSGQLQLGPAAWVSRTAYT
mmetsp:Transcript_46076/g.116584  ORF Transcript_46076/g.116584 Transcript_46076/m.116584 type:complete len:202 (-) Transcript_46076:577-1182(-)